LKLLDQTLAKGETRTDWRRRPLSRRQIDYALQDVVYLQPMRDVLCRKLDQLERRPWWAAESAAWQEELNRSVTVEPWRRVSGISGLSRRSLAVVRELWRWREKQAQQRDCPTRRVLRDDLLVELARRGTSDLARIRAIRGMDRRDLQRHLPDISRCIARAFGLTDDILPAVNPRQTSPYAGVLGQFLATALGVVCRSKQLAPSLVGTAQDVRALIEYRLGADSSARSAPPRLARGWRAEVVGQLIDDLLAGKMSIRIRDPRSENPLAFEPVETAHRGAPSES
jgi:ribonuclease D